MAGKAVELDANALYLVEAITEGLRANDAVKTCFGMTEFGFGKDQTKLAVMLADGSKYSIKINVSPVVKKE